jgi:hypothetical protein
MKGNITISRPTYGDDRKLITIQVKDRESVTRFLDIEIEYDNFAQLITGLSEVEIDFTVRDLEHVGKVREVKELEFPIGSGFDDRKEVAIREAKKHTPDGWVCDNYFGSQTSFFTKDDVSYARTTIKRWK